MNFIFISPNFPQTYWNFCERLRRRGVTVLGIGDAPYEGLSPELKANLNEYYRVGSPADYAHTLPAPLMPRTVFLIAGTAILAISGSAQIAKIYTEIHSLDSEISSYKEKISLLRKEQSTLNDYTTINEANQNVGRVMSWNDN